MIKALFNPTTGVYRCSIDTNIENYQEKMEDIVKRVFRDNKIDDWIDISDEDYHKYLLGTFGGDNGTGYIRDIESGQCISAPPRTYSFDEQINQIQAKYMNQLEILREEFIDATLKNEDTTSHKARYSAIIENSNAEFIECINQNA